MAGAASGFRGRERGWAGARAGGGYSPIIGASNSRVGSRASLSHNSRACDDGVTRAIRPGETHGARADDPLVAMSGYAFANLDSPAPDFLRMALELGAARCLRKPFTPGAGR